MSTSAALQGAAAPALSYADRTLFKNGKPHRIIAGAVHYFRVHPDQWQDRIDRLVALGVNTLDTYVAWNFHQPYKDVAPDFTGWRDLARFITLAGDAGLDVIVRPGPYICAEWDNGGFPSWAISNPEMVLRSSDPLFTNAVGAWFEQLLPIIEPLQACHGGPVVALQIENEYGSYGDDQAYLRWNRQALLDGGMSELLFTADGGTDYFLDGGSLPDTWATATLGSRGKEADEIWERRRPGEPFFTVEFWNGWFDHWGDDHHTRPAPEAAAEAKSVLDVNGSICLYMAHGGTNFGLGSGANHDGVIQPTVTSYDSDAPIAEDGRLTEKFFAMREAFFAAEGRELTEVPEALLRPAPVLPATTVPLTPGTPLLDIVRAAESVASVKPLTFEQLGLDRGLVHYSAKAAPCRTGRGPSRFAASMTGRISGSMVSLPASSTTRRAPTASRSTARAFPYSWRFWLKIRAALTMRPLFGQGKGILDGVLINQRYVFHWEQRAIDLDQPLEELLQLGTEEGTDLGAGFFHGELTVDESADSYVALPGFGKGLIWINGFLLGRYWEIGRSSRSTCPSRCSQPGATPSRCWNLSTEERRWSSARKPSWAPSG
ncbi:glycoside hydrolase family 35 protein [Arthrobacter psychrolactophilus]